MKPEVAVGSKPPISSMDETWRRTDPRPSLGLDDDVALVELDADDTVDRLLRGGHGGHDKFSLGREEEAVVEDVGKVGGDELVSERSDVAVERHASRSMWAARRMVAAGDS